MVDVDTGKVMEFHDEELEKLQHEIANKEQATNLLIIV
jgi:Fe2+ or Zn2+ uptake regulation protein